MDRQRLRWRLRLILAVGGIVTALVYLGIIAHQAKLRWASYRAEAELEDGWADTAALNATLMEHAADLARRQGRMGEAEQRARYLKTHLQEESLHRRKSREWLGRW